MRRSGRKRQEEASVAASALDRRHVIRRARAEFDARHPAPAALSALAGAIASTVGTDDAELAATERSLAEEQLAAALEFLDATTRLAPELIEFQTVEVMARTVDRLSAALDPGFDLLIQAQRLAAATSLALLTGQPALGIAHQDDHRRLIAQARRVLRELQKQHGDVVRDDDIWVLRVVGDALDLAGDPEGSVLLRLAEGCRVGSGWGAARRRLGRANVEPIENAELDLEEQIRRLPSAALTWNTIDRLPEITARVTQHERYGRGLLGEHNRARAQLNRPLVGLAAVLVGTILLAGFVAVGRPILANEPIATWTFTLDLVARDALAMATALLAVSGAVAVALAVLIRPESSVPIRYEAARRWWTVGIVVILLCGIVSVGVGVLEALARDQHEWWATGLTLVVGMLNFLLIFGVTQWQDEPRLRGWRERLEAQSLEAQLRAERRRMPGDSESRIRPWLRATAIAALPAGLAAISILVNAGIRDRTAQVALVAGLAVLAVAVVLVRIAVEWRRLALVDPGGRTTRMSLTLASASLSMFLFVVPVLAWVVEPGWVTWRGLGPWLAGYVAFLIIVVRSRWSTGPPTRFIRRWALRIAERAPHERRQFARDTRGG